MKKSLYITVLFLLPVLLHAQNVRAIKTSTQPEVRNNNNAPVPVIPKNNSQNNLRQNNNSKKLPSVKRVDPKPAKPANNPRRNQK